MQLIAKFLTLCAALALASSAAFAQVIYVNGDGTNLIAGAITSQNAYIIMPGYQWSSGASNNSTVSANTTFSAGVSSGGGINAYTTNGLYQPADYLSNASLRGYVQGYGFTGTPTTLTARFRTYGSPVTISIWGPTLNNYGVSGVGYFYWTITSDAGTSSGFGEVDSSGHYGYITVTVEAAVYSAGDALIQANG
jgi:hypothetical protein